MSNPLKEPEKLSDVFMTVKDVAQLCHITEDGVRYWLETGRLPVVRAGRRVLIPSEAVAAMLAGKTDGKENH